MEEQLISFDTAKLAKEKGFKELCFNYYNLKQELQYPYLENGSSSDVDYRVDLEDLLEQHNNPYHNTYSAPTQSLLQKWLREKHNIHITPQDRLVGLYSIMYEVIIYDVVNFKIIKHGHMRDARFTTYEEALEKGLTEALKLIK